MSWIVQNLLSNRTRIKEKTNVFEKEYRVSSQSSLLDDVYSTDYNYDGQGYLDPQIENDEFNDLILIEKAIKDLQKKGVLNEEELKILNHVKDGDRAFMDTEEFNKPRYTLVKEFERLCERIAFYMGGYFTNDGYIDYVVEKFKLTNEQEHILRNYISSRYKHMIVRRKPAHAYTR